MLIVHAGVDELVTDWMSCKRREDVIEVVHLQHPCVSGILHTPLPCELESRYQNTSYLTLLLSSRHSQE